ncbi:disulfide bond formation protein B [Aestuariivirga sp.]|uniref:disulfide bond formation protein B n=1 Tax=Aestuariivirga sp. TaxID=2650926 RepID=UPI003BAD03F1
MAKLLPRLVFWSLHLWVLGYTAVLGVALLLQFVGGELPCPLCMLQRYGMILTTLGALWIIRDARNGTLTPVRYLQCLGLGALGAFAGSAFADRQVLLHILPGDPGFGGPIMGLHLYSWSLITFLVVIVFTAILGILAPTAMPEAPPEKSFEAKLSSAVVVAFLAVVAINAVMIVFLEGFAWVLPDDPSRYNLFSQLG